jgi:hypothetical protein
VGAGGAGGLGSQRYADALGQSLADVELGLAGQQAELMYKGYQDAIANAFKQAQEERQAAAAQGDLATLAQELGLTEAAALTKFGAEEQALGQAEIEALVEDGNECRPAYAPVSDTTGYYRNREGS